MYTKIKKLFVSELGDILIQKSVDDNVYVEAPKSVQVIQDSENLTIKGNGLNSKSGVSLNSKSGISVSSFSGNSCVISDGDIFIGNRHISVGSGRSVKIVNNKVWVDGKLVPSGKDETEEEEKTQTIIKIPDGLNVTFKECSDMVFESDFSFQNFVLQIVGQGDVNAKAITASSTTITVSAQSEVEIDTLSSSMLVATVSSQSELCIENGSLLQAVLTTSGQSEMRVRGKIENVVATASGQSTLKFSKPTNSPVISSSGQSTCKAI